jgi:hypothetical protein
MHQMSLKSRAPFSELKLCHLQNELMRCQCGKGASKRVICRVTRTDMCTEVCTIQGRTCIYGYVGGDSILSVLVTLTRSVEIYATL